MQVVTRFAPSPTGFLHIGGARTALFNWLFAKHYKGTFLLRIEDTDLARSTQEAKAAILDGLAWLELLHDDQVYYQSQHAKRHTEIANELLGKGNAYKCYCSEEEVEAMRQEAKAEGKPMKYNGKCRKLDPAKAPKDAPFVVRLAAPLEGTTTFTDMVQGEITVANEQLDDMVLLRSDGTPTYMLAVVVDDHDMGITHVIRGDDHLTNGSRQILIYQAMGWDIPSFAHIPLIHGPDGAKMSKRHGALGVDAYRDMGLLPAGLRNYLLRLGWSHGDDEIISTDQAIEWFDGTSLNKAPARFDLVKLMHVNSHYLRQLDNQTLLQLTLPIIESLHRDGISEIAKERLLKGMDGLKQRAKNLRELAESALFFVAQSPIPINDAAFRLLSEGGFTIVQQVTPVLDDLKEWNAQDIEAKLKAHAEAHQMKLGTIAQSIRAAVTGTTISPSVFEVLAALGRKESMTRLKAVRV